MLRDINYVEISEDTPVKILAALLEVAVMLRDRKSAALLAPKLDAITAFATPLTNVALPVGAAAALLGDRTSARVHFHRALQWASSLQYRPEVARVRLALGELLLVEARAEAFAHLDFAVEELRAMKMQQLLEHALRLRGHRTSPAGLSARELEVLRLMSDGKSNQEIADRLVISLNTILHHVSSIFAKTGTANRAEAASWAVRRGLGEPD